jgi:exonuclease III
MFIRRETYHRRKIDEIETILINDKNIDIICLSETWLDVDITDSQVDIDGYKFFRKDRLGNLARGAGMYITHALPHRRALELELPDIDLLWVELQLCHKKIFIGACYRPPSQNVEEVDKFMSDLEDSLELAFQAKPESIFLLGDLNDSCSVWESSHPKSELGLKLYDYINAHDLHQMILEPTYYSPTGSANILDLLITDSPGYIQN